jgi:endothelin-converting enzyme/putative endopeptidase
MIRNLVIIVATAFAPVLASYATPARASDGIATAAPAGGGNKGIELGDIDRAADACTDFYDFANGTWRAENPIPASMSQWSRRVAARETNRQRILSVLEDVSRKTDWKPGSVEQLVGDHYASCMDEAAVDAAGLTPLAPLLAEIDGLRNPADVQRVIRRLHDIAVAVPLTINGATDYDAPAKFILNIGSGGLGLSDRNYYLKAEPEFAEAREKYRVHVANVLKLGGMPDAQARDAVEGIFALEKRLAEASLDSAIAGDQAATDHKATFAELKEMAPHFDWNAYFDEAKLPRADLNVAEPKFVRQLDKELNETPVAIWKAYLKWQLLNSASPWLSKAFVEESFDFTDKYLGKAIQMKPRAQRCADSTEALLGEALGKKYVERYFPPAAKAKSREIALNLLAALKDEVAGVQWMTPETKRKALEKLSAADIQMGYPDTWDNYSGLIVRRNAFWANVAAARAFLVTEERSRIGKATNRDLWALAPSSPDAYIDLQLNKLVLPAGFLQPPYFNVDATDAVNYGAFGVGLAHDLTHAIDASGSEIDITGQPRNWWTSADRDEFEKRGQCVVDQFDGYFIEPGVHHDGKRVLSESIGDLAGVRIAYLALEKSMKTHPVATLDGFTPEQQFFISWGQNSGAAMRIEAQRQRVSADPHPVPKFRVVGPLSNSPEFQQAFSCEAGAEMVRQAEKRCAVW